MSACGEFAEHVWKPGSCKNCFHPRSAHRATGGSTAPCGAPRASLGGEEEEDGQGVTAPSPYSKPTIAVRPTMMHPDINDMLADLNMNTEQDSQKVSGDRLGLKKMLDLSPIYIDGCNEALREAVPRRATMPGKTEQPCSRYSPGPLSPLSPVLPFGPQKDSSMILSSVFVTQEDGHGRGPLSPHALKGNANGNGDASYRQQIAKTTKITKSTYTGNGVGPARAPRGPSVVHSSAVRGVSIDVIAACTMTASSGVSNDVSATVTASSNGLTCGAAEPSNASPVPAFTPLSSGPSLGPVLQPCGGGRTNSFFSEPVSCLSLSDSCSYRSSSDSLTGPNGFGPLGPDCPTPPSASSTSPNSPLDGPTTSEPIYAESTKRKRKPHCVGLNGTPLAQKQRSDADAELAGEGQNQRAKITVMAAHTEENNRTFYLSSPDSAVSTQWPHFSPTALSNPGSPAFKWPSNPSVTEPVSLSTPTSPACIQPKPQNSPPIPPKRNNRSPKIFLGASSLSPVPLPELSIQGIQTLSLSPREKDAQVKPLSEPPSSASSDARRHKLHASSRNWEVRIEEEEEEGETEEGHSRESASRSRATGLINGTAVWREARERRPAGGMQGSTQTLPGTVDNNGASQRPMQAGSSAEEGKHCRSMLAKTPPSPLSSTEHTELSGEGKSSSHDPSPPPPPPKKHHRASGKMSQSSMEVDQRSQQGSVESLTSSVRGLGSSSLLTASTDSLPGDSTRALSDSGSHDATRLSPFPRSPMTSSPGSPHPEQFPSNNLSNRLQPPPLPEKKMVNRTFSAPDSASGKPLVRAYPRLPFAGGSESNVSHPDVLSQSSLLSSTVDPRPLYSSSESLERCHGPLGRTVRSQTMDEPLKVCGRLGGHSRGSVTSSSSPQLSAAHHSASGPSHGSSLQLQTLLSNIDSREGIYSKLGGLYAESLRRLALKCEDHFTRSQKNPLRFDESNWSLFKLTCNKASCNAGDAVYYSATCASDPSNSYAVKICKSQTSEAKQAHLYGLSIPQSLPPHFNLQQDCGHFIACVPQSMLPGDEASPPAGHNPTQGDKERVVVITREVPQQTTADFVKEWVSFHQAQPEVYERRVCFLLLQLCNGLEHLKEHGVTHRDLCLENLLLVPHRRPTQANPNAPYDQKHLPRLVISSFAKAKQRNAEDSAVSDPRLKRDHARLAPEIVSAAQYRKFDEFQTGILIYELLHQPNPFEVSPKLKEQDYSCEDLPTIPSLSLYSAGLQRLTRLLLQPDPIKRIHIQEAKRVLQSLLWGPRKELMEQQQWGDQDRPGPGEGPRQEGLLNWLDVKRALLMMKFAERSLEPERNAELEDWLCCQYFSSAHPLSLCLTAEMLYSLK
ncbi:inactive tyrosine-protein kinase PRAG1 [Esox lucius]|uniref:Protein kinase domain-containing protein n=1 Tax=Esox lucius TaxID=8010 RepID=A0A3P8ZPE7_ESOLU|nr:inactive tyrosine-protein kinase PRAG1 [Esox lucius]XP_010891136.3 inactive tyrosine-protein kinase PRAG1 [Esox lucius]